MDSDLAGRKLAGWCSLYAVAMLFMGFRIFARLYIVGPMAIDDWLIIAAMIAYTGCMITEIFVWIALFKNFNLTMYIKVLLILIELLKTVFFCFVLLCYLDDVAHQIFGVVFHEATHTWTKDEHLCQLCMRHLGRFLHRIEHLQSHMVCTNTVIMGTNPDWFVLGFCDADNSLRLKNHIHRHFRWRYEHVH